MLHTLPDQKIDTYMIAVVIAAIIYNAILAVINSSVMPLALFHVAITEFVILLSVMGYIAAKGIYPEDKVPLMYIGFTIFIAVYMSIVNQTPVLEYTRNILIVFGFFVTGTRSNQKTIRILFMIAAGLVLLILLMEIFLGTQYADLFYPMSYYENTRGLKQVSYGGSKLFQNSNHFEGRFSFELIDHRANSLFLEQVSLSNFAGVLMLFTISFWTRLKFFERIFFPATVTLILLTTDSRTMLIFAGVCIVGYHIFPRIPAKLSLLSMPSILFMGFLIYLKDPFADGDNFSGRVVKTMQNVFETDIQAFLGLRAQEAAGFPDSGYVYIVYAGTIFGFLAFWLFVSLYPLGESPNQRRCAHALSFFMFLNLMIGATPVFTIKIAALMWYFIGHMKYSESRSTSWQLDSIYKMNRNFAYAENTNVSAQR